MPSLSLIHLEMNCFGTVPRERHLPSGQVSNMIGSCSYYLAREKYGATSQSEGGWLLCFLYLLTMNFHDELSLEQN